MEYAVRLEEPTEVPTDPRNACAAEWREVLPRGRLAALYFGSEFCEDRIPGHETGDAFCRAAKKRRLEAALLSPPVTADGLARIDALLRFLARRGFRPAVVFNDWGVLRLLAQDHPALPRRAGRLLNRSLRDPRAGPAAYPDGTGARGGRLRAFLAGRGVEALETDPDLEGTHLGDGEEGLQRVLHLPYSFVASGRNCLLKTGAEAPEAELLGGSGGPGVASRLGSPCSLRCRGGPLAVRRQDTRDPLWRAGNTLFCEVSRDAARFHLGRADRVVLHRRPSP
ncbi:MAG: hypothetical protein SCH98_01060 [Deferrisomatales bacterium]|nr:hypothetical protein [Deferrisomatales bacterium]